MPYEPVEILDPISGENRVVMREVATGESQTDRWIEAARIQRRIGIKLNEWKSNAKRKKTVAGQVIRQRSNRVRTSNMKNKIIA